MKNLKNHQKIMINKKSVQLDFYLRLNKQLKNLFGMTIQKKKMKNLKIIRRNILKIIFLEYLVNHLRNSPFANHKLKKKNNLIDNNNNNKIIIKLNKKKKLKH